MSNVSTLEAGRIGASVSTMHGAPCIAGVDGGREGGRERTKRGEEYDVYTAYVDYGRAAV